MYLTKNGEDSERDGYSEIRSGRSHKIHRDVKRTGNSNKNSNQSKDRTHIIETSGGALPEIYAYVPKNDGMLANERYTNTKGFVDNYKFDPHTFSILDALCRRLDLIEKSIGASNIIEATPVANLVSLDIASKNSINSIYNRWITFMEYIAQQMQSRRFDDLFWAADKNLFNDFFAEKSYRIKFVGSEEEYRNVDPRYVKEAWAYDRNGEVLLHPQDREYVQYYLNDNEKEIYLFYLVKEIQNLTEKVTPNDRLILSGQHSLISGLDSHSLPVLHDTLTIQRDERHRYLGGHRILFNTTVDTNTLDRLQDSIYRAGNTPLLMVCIILVHAMIHVKCRLTYGIEAIGNTRHTQKRFVEEIIRHVPPALFGHPMLPLITFKESNEEEL